MLKAIRYMLGQDKFDLCTMLDHPLWQMRVREFLARVRVAIQRAYYVMREPIALRMTLWRIRQGK